MPRSRDGPCTARSTAIPPQKTYDERRDAILEVAQRLFFADGYEATSVNAVIDAAEISKGTFYHYFNSKQELLAELALRATQAVRDAVLALDTMPGLCAPDRLSRIFLTCGRWKSDNRDMLVPLLRALQTDENVLLRRRMNETFVELVQPEIAAVMQQGIDEGSFQLDNAEDAAEVVFVIMLGMNESISGLVCEMEDRPELWPVVQRKVTFFGKVLERALGADPGSMTLVDYETLRKFKPEGA